MRVSRHRPTFDPPQVPDVLLGHGRTMPPGVERVNALAAYLDEREALYYGAPIPGRIDALALFLYVPGQTWDDFVTQHRAPFWK